MNDTTINFEELDKKFTEEEYLLLIKRLNGDVYEPSLAQILYRYLYGDDTLIKENIVLYKKCKNLSEEVLYHNTDHFHTMFKMPFDLAPLYINGISIKYTIAIWRLEIGK